MAKIENTLECIDTLMGKMKANGITKLKYSSDDFELELKTEKEQPIFAQQSFLAPAQVPQPAPMAQNSATVASGNVVKSPIVGTFYSSPSPEKPAFVSVGQTVKKGDVLMVIESMKLMNEIASDFDGVVAEIMVKSGTAVEFDQPIMRIE